MKALHSRILRPKKNKIYVILKITERSVCVYTLTSQHKGSDRRQDHQRRSEQSVRRTVVDDGARRRHSGVVLHRLAVGAGANLALQRRGAVRVLPQLRHHLAARAIRLRERTVSHCVGEEGCASGGAVDSSIAYAQRPVCVYKRSVTVCSCGVLRMEKACVEAHLRAERALGGREA